MSSSREQIRVVVNGREMEIQEGTALDGLLERLTIGTAGVAVELNREIIPRGSHGTTVLQEGDTVEVIQMVGGG
ncbi:MAG: sulfur carrier protein ThiS [Thermodesulfobacteriota bacterium]